MIVGNGRPGVIKAENTGVAGIFQKNPRKIHENPWTIPC